MTLHTESSAFARLGSVDMSVRGFGLKATLLFTLLLSAACGEEKAQAYIPPGTTGGGNNGKNNGVGMGDASIDSGPGGTDLDANGGNGNGSGGEPDASSAGGMDASMDASVDAGMDAGKDAGKDAGEDAGDDSDAGDASAPVIEAPYVTVVTPLPATDPDVDEVLTGTQVTVTCEVIPFPGGSPVDTESVKVAVYQGDSVIPTGALAPAQSIGNNLFRVTNFNLGALNAGKLRFECTASDTQDRTRSAIISTLYDRGPSITFTSPSNNAVVSRASQVLVEFNVSPNDLTASDTESDIGTVSLLVGGKDVSMFGAEPLVHDTVDPARYTYTIKFNDPQLFPSPPTLLELKVNATNKRTANAASATRTIAINVDGDGPTISITKPVDLQMVGSQIIINANVTDGLSGIKPGSVIVRVEDSDEIEEPLTPSGGAGLYVGGIQTGAFNDLSNPAAPKRSELTLNLFAEDNAGNESFAEVSVYLDNVPPWVSLNPPMIREIFTSTVPGGGLGPVCSLPFDPVGNNAANPNEDLDPVALFRAFVWERTVEVQGAITLYYAGIDNALTSTAVQLWLQKAPGVPMLRDTGTDGFCDSVDSTRGILLTLRPVSYNQPTYSLSTSAHLASAPDATNVCSVGTLNTNQPAMCQNTEMTYVTRHTYTTAGVNTPVIYARDPTNAYQATSNDCTGRGWQPGFTGGWTCATALATDLVGNTGIAEPMPVCFDLNPGDCPDNNPPPTLDCTNNCELRDVDLEWGRSPIIQR